MNLFFEYIWQEFLCKHKEFDIQKGFCYNQKGAREIHGANGILKICQKCGKEKFIRIE